MIAGSSFKITAALLAAAAVGAIAVRALPANSSSDVRSSNASARAILEAQQPSMPPSEADAAARLSASPRHGEWVTIQLGRNATTGTSDSTRAYVVYPMRSDKAPVVIVVHEIFGLTPWVRSVADQLAADGFIAIAPDFLTMKNLPGSPADGPPGQQATAAIRTVTTQDVNRQIDAAAKYGMSLAAATQKYGVVGYCWGGAAAFNHALHSATLGASVAYYGTAPAPSAISTIKAPILGLFAATDARVNNTIPPFDSAMKAAGKQFTQHTFEGSQHGFLRQSNAGNVEASRKAWPLTVQFLKANLEAK